MAARNIILGIVLAGSVLAGGWGVTSAQDPVARGTPPSVVTNSTVAVDAEKYVISDGDKLSYRVLEDREDPKKLEVSPSGEIEVPYLGRVMVAGKKLKTAAEEIKALLEKELYSQATVILSVVEIAPEIVKTPSAGKPKQVFVVGQVKMQGTQEIYPGEKYMLSRAIIKAGGLGPFANGKKVQVIRKEPSGRTIRITVDILSVLIHGKMENDLELMPDDMIIVPESWIKM